MDADEYTDTCDISVKALMKRIAELRNTINSQKETIRQQRVKIHELEQQKLTRLIEEKNSLITIMNDLKQEQEIFNEKVRISLKSEDE